MKSALRLIGRLLLLALVVCLVIWFVTLGFSVLRSLDADTRSATIALVGVLAVPIITFATQFAMEKKRSREQVMREKRLEFYEGVIVLFMSMLGSTTEADHEKADDVDFVTEMNKLTPRMILYGSKGFMEAWNTLRSVSASNIATQGSGGEIHLNRMIAAMEGLMSAARRDLGHRVSTLEQGVYAATFINDLDLEGVRTAHKELRASNSRR